MSKWFDGDDDTAATSSAADPDTDAAPACPAPPPNKYLIAPDQPGQSSSAHVTDTESPGVPVGTGDVVGSGPASSYLTPPSPAPQNKAPEASRVSKASKASKASRAAKVRKSGTAGRGSRSRVVSLPHLPKLPAIPKPVKIGGAVVALVGVLGVAGTLGAAYFGADGPPITAASGSQTSLSPIPTPETTPAAPTTSNLPPTEQVVVSGDCTASAGETTMRPTPKSLRGTVAQFYAEYAGRNAEGIGATLDDKSSMKKQDWKAVFAQLPTEASFCVRMGKDTGHSVEVQVTMTGDGVAETFEQKATGIRRDGQWKILELEGNSK